jgi:hypothetical protein
VKLRNSFAEQYSLGDPELASVVPAVIQSAIQENGVSWVLKPQREGGGNNYYGENLAEFLQKHQNDPVLAGELCP